MQIACQRNKYAEEFLQLIPKQIDPSQKQSPQDFTRKRKLPLDKLIVFILSLVASGTARGVDVKSGQFFRNARRSGLWPEAEAVHRASVSKARKKVPSQLFEDILEQAVNLAYECFPEDPKYLWHGMSVFAVDGSNFDLPATDEIRAEFDPTSGLQNKGKGHYPQALVSTLYDVFRRLPTARTVVPINSSEREEAKELARHLPAASVALFDRGYPSYEFIRHLTKESARYFIFRCPASQTFPAVEAFVQSGKQEDTIWIDPSANYLNKVGRKNKNRLKPIKLRIVRLVSPDETVSVLLTNLYSKREFPTSEIIELYFRRWEVENYYRDEKVTLEIEKFHGRTCNSIRQELLAAVIMSVISRTLMALSEQKPEIHLGGEPQFKNAIMTLASEAAVLAPENPEHSLEIFVEILEEIHRVRYYSPKKPRPSQIRVTKKRQGKWAISKTKKVLKA